MNDDEEVIRIRVNKDDVPLSPSLLEPKIIIENLKIADLAREAVIKEYSYLGGQPVTKV